MAWRRRQWVARLAAPAAFLAAATIAVLIVRAAIHDDGVESPPVRTIATAPSTTPATTAPPPAPKRTFYVIRRGDTLASVADRYGTTVEALVELNPGIDPIALNVGQRIRVQ